MILSRYITKEIYLSTIAITVIVLLVFVTNQFTHFLKVAAHGGITLMTVLQITALQIPLLLGYLLPLGLYLAILLVFGRLYVDHEVTVMSACGLSQARLSFIILLASLPIMIIVAVLMCWVEPLAETAQINVFNNALQNITIAKIVPHRFQQLPNGSVFYASIRNHQATELRHAFFIKPMGKQIEIVAANRVTQTKNSNHHQGRFLVFHNGYHYLGEPGTIDFRIVKFNSLGINRIVDHRQYSHWSLTASTAELWRLRHKKLAAAAILQWRMSLPISVLLLTLLALPLAKINPRNGKFAKFVPAILIYVGYADLLYLGRVWITKGVLNPTIGIWWIHGIVLLLVIIFNLFPWIKRNYKLKIARKCYAHT